MKPRSRLDRIVGHVLAAPLYPFVAVAVSGLLICDAFDCRGPHGRT